MPANASVHIVGIGPGGGDRYLTGAAREVLQVADLVIFPGTQISASIRTLIQGQLKWGRWFSDDESLGWVQSAVEAGQRVAWLCSGDPSLYSGEPGRFGSLSMNAAWLRSEGVVFDVLPGVSSLQAFLARMGMEHAGPDSGCPLVCYAPGRDPAPMARQRLEALVALDLPLALFFVDRSFQLLVEVVTRYAGPDARVLVGHRIGWPDERIIDCAAHELLQITNGTEVPMHTLVLVGPWRG